ncbi:hypothetical protein BC936DRAFT_146067 [Jimgerdemannia flammicorona]|uniref:Uncharacterized protein n=1 Tax=Jimgerdemannia flammicorona TaxID=994334 RepID=A0A433D8F5_9FUNG|nr:hypothetical protein BC936DRAFT_146067 [Jimgerdemannia flammicorona]
MYAGMDKVEASVVKRASPHIITVINKCSLTIWPGLYSSAGGSPSPAPPAGNRIPVPPTF